MEPVPYWKWDVVMKAISNNALSWILVSGNWMFLDPTVSALLNIQQQVSSIQHRPHKSDCLTFTPQEELKRFMQR